MTTGVTVAVVGAPGTAPQLGKKGTSSDLTLYNSVRDGHAITLVEPTQFPEKFSPLLVTLTMAHHALLVVETLSRAVAETIATLELVDVPTTIVLGGSVGDAELTRALKGGRLESAPRLPLDLPRLREAIEARRAPAAPGPVQVPIDHAFPVKGVGSVALGVVRQGTLRVHDKLRLWPSPTLVEVRSIQVHDIDRKDAESGERVGLALKGVEADELSRGQILAPPGALLEGATLVGGPLARCRYYRGNADAGARLNVVAGLQSAPAILESASAEGVRIAADRPLVFAPDTPAYLLDLSVGAGPRIVGRTLLRSPA